MAQKRKRVTMTVTVSCPAWMTAQEARREVRTLINEQCFYGAARRDEHRMIVDEVEPSNFRAVSVRAGGLA